MKHITRDRRLTPEEAARYNAIRAEIAAELPDLNARHHAGWTRRSAPTKAAREARGLEFTAVTAAIGVDASVLNGSGKAITPPPPAAECLV